MVSTHYLGHVLTFLIENRYVGHHAEYADQDRIWLRSNNFWQRNAPWTLKISINSWFLLIVSVMHLHFDLKFSI